MSLATHLRALVDNPRGVAALTPTSRACIDRVVSKVPAEAERVVEFGPGSGVLTRALLRRLRPEARLLAIELSEELAELLRARLPDPRLTVVQGDAARVRRIVAESDLGAVDCVVSAIPFFWLGPEEGRALIADTHAALADGGSFVSCQMFYLPRRRLHDHLERCFRTVRSELDLRNLPPQKIFHAVK